jgi:Uma2 family endonuclease
MTEQEREALAALGLAAPPTQDELPYDDGMPMESERHLLQMNLLIETLRLHWKDRPTGYVGGNMFVYFSLERVKNEDFRGPDFFAVLGVPKKERKSWVVWEENKAPDVVIELLSDSTRALDKGEKKRVYQDELRVPEYFLYDPFSGELAGFWLGKGRYRPIRPDREGHLGSGVLGLMLLRREGSYQGCQAPWLRWMTPQGQVLPTQQELADEQQRRADEQQRRAEEQQRRAEQAEAGLQHEAAEKRALQEKLQAMEAELQRLRRDPTS